MLVNLKALRKTRKKMIIAKGIYNVPSLYKFNFSILLDIHGINYQNLTRIWDSKLEKETLGYGVCDNYEQILNHFPELINSKKKYIVALSKVTKGIEGSPFAWRWHKWGRYIGEQKPTTEYLYDEPVIEEVYVFRIYEIKQ